MTASLWSARRLLLTMSSQSASTFANQMVAFVIPWLVLSRTGSALHAGGEDGVPLVRASSLQETLQNTAQFVGPLAAGFLIAAVAEQGALLVAWVAVYVPLSTLIFTAWCNFARESAGALGLFLAAQALGGRPGRPGVRG